MIKEILARKRESVAEREREKPLESFISQLKSSDRDFETALRAKKPAFILEMKKASPSLGLIRADFNVAELAKAYAPFASVVSVLTDEPYFNGSFANLTQARKALSCPVLCKDFVISPYQVYEARRHGADAILLMLSVLDDDTYQACVQVAKELSMGVLTEVHSEVELVRAVTLDARVIGINNRNFSSLKVDLNVSHELMLKVPSDRVLVVESGISGHADVMKFRDRTHAFLIGSALMREPRVDLATREMLFGRVKVCGITSEADAIMAYNEGAVWGGLIFAPESPRVVDVDLAERIVHAVPLQWVGVFVNSELGFVSDTVSRLKLAAVQLHGEEDVHYIERLRTRLPQGVEIWKAVRVQWKIPTCSEWKADRILLDTYQAERRGGTGNNFDWSLLDDYPEKDRLILSGGVSIDNAKRAEEIGAWAVDVNSRVEDWPGRKSHEKLHHFFQILRGNPS